MERYLRRDRLTPGLIALALLVAAGLGALHALGPGHGKAMAAAYLIGAHARVRHAILLGAVVTFTHVVGVLLLGVALLLASDFLLPQRLYPWLGAAAGLVISGVGLLMLVRRAVGGEPGHGHKHGHEHHHHHRDHAHGEEAQKEGELEHEHEHQHQHQHGHEQHAHDDEHEGHDHGGHGHTHALPEQVTLGSLVGMGVSAGLVPCPSALVVLLLAVALHRIAFGLLLIVAFSLGLAAVLIATGVVVVKATAWVERLPAGQRWVRVLPVVSAVLVMLLGLAVAVESLLAGGVLVWRG